MKGKQKESDISKVLRPININNEQVIFVHKSDLLKRIINKRLQLTALRTKNILMDIVLKLDLSQRTSIGTP